VATPDPYKWTKWASQGGGQNLAQWLSIVVGLIAAIWVFHLVPHWYLAAPAGIIVWLLATYLVGALWAVVRLVVERYEGIRW
jgi:hypothetical protein